jgi:hypothetical protein
MMARAAQAARRARILISVTSPVAVAYCLGTLDRRAVEDLAARVRGLLFEGVRGFVCSLERVEHIHFQALEALLGLHGLVADAGGRLVLAGASPYLQQILDFGGIPGRVRVAPNKMGAVQELHESLSPEAAAVPAGVQPSLL